MDQARITDAYKRHSRARRESGGTSISAAFDDESMLAALHSSASDLEEMELRLLVAVLPVEIAPAELARLGAQPAFRSVLRQLAFAEMVVTPDEPGEYVDLVLGGSLHEECPTMCMCLRSLAQSCTIKARMLQERIDYEHQVIADQAVREALSSAPGLFSGRLIRLGHAIAQRTQIPAHRLRKPMLRDRSSEVASLSLASEAMTEGWAFLEGLSLQVALAPDRWEDDAAVRPVETAQTD